MRIQSLLFALTIAVLALSASSASTLYVDLNSTNPVAPFSSWATAATNIQDGIDAAADGDQIFVNDGIYKVGSRTVYGAANRVAVDKAVRLQSVHGAAATVIDGAAAMRCIYLTNNASVIGFTITNGAAFIGTDTNKQLSGGGAWCEPTNSVLMNCVVISNWASFFGGGVFGGIVSNSTIAYNGFTPSEGGKVVGFGGGTFTNTLHNCVLMGNQASIGAGAGRASLCGCTIVSNITVGGGAALACVLTNCVIAGNINTYNSPFTTMASGALNCFLYNCTVCDNYGGGGSFGSTNYNCIIYDNPRAPNYDSRSMLTNCCTTPLPMTGSGNFTNAPLFVNEAGGDYHLQANSPCIDTGNNAYVNTATDLDGNPRIVSDIVDVGAYEFQVRYVDVNGTNPTPPFVDWSTAATNIQDAIDAAPVNALVLVTNGVYQSGGRFVYGSLSNRVVVDKPVTVESVSGPAVTAIEGYLDPGDGTASVRCVYLTNDAKLIGFTLTNGSPAYDGDPILEQSGGGAFCDGANVVISNCWMIGNWATLDGAGVYGGILNNCVFSQNNAINGGGAFDAVLNCCVLSNNAASYGAAAENCELTNCAVTGNSANYGGGIYGGTTVNSLIASNSGNGGGGGAEVATVIGCTIYGNTVAKGGGGVDGCTVLNCTLTNNSAAWGGGANESTLTNCLICENQAGLGGGTDGGTVDACLIVANVSGDYGGGCEGGTVYNSIIANNSTDSTGYGGAVDAGTMYNCIIATNSSQVGGGAFESTLNNCTVVGNSAQQSGGGVSDTVLRNCIVYYNDAPSSPNFDVVIGEDPEDLSSSVDYCCTTPLPTNGLGNFINAPLFVSNNDLHLQSNSPCINSGNNGFVALTKDLDGNPRVVKGTVDMGAYEFQSTSSVISYAWLEDYGLPTDGSVDFLDLDGTGMTDYQKWIAGLNPTNAASVLMMLLPAVSTNSSGVAVSWESVSNRTYYLQRATNLIVQPAFSTIQSNLAGSLTGTNIFTDTNAVGQGPYFYRVGVQ